MSFLVNPFLNTVLAGDPNWASVVLLVGADSTVTDESPYHYPLNASGNAAVTTSQQKFGAGSLTFDGTNDRVTRSNTAEVLFANGEFTVEAWCRFVAKANNQCVVSVWGTTVGASAWAVWIESNQLGLRIAVGSTPIDYHAAFTPVLGQWYHVAVSRSNTATRVFVDGVIIHTTTEAPRTMNTSSASLAIGAVSPSGSFPTYDYNGQIDELRITKGVARYSANFTPPTAAFPRS